MIYTKIPGVRIFPSVLCLGTGGFGSDVPEGEALAMLDAFAEGGGNFADTAHIYAAWLPGGEGQSERTLGKWLAGRRPKDFLVGTKGGHPDLKTMHISRLDPESIARDLAESLDRLGVDSVAMYWLHRDDPQVPVDEVLGALQDHVAAGRAGALGASNWSVQRIMAAKVEAERRGWTGFSASQVGWSLAEINPAVRGAMGMGHMDGATLQWHRDSGFPVVAYSSQANGFFGHPLPEPGVALTDKQKALETACFNEPNFSRHAQAQSIGRSLGRSTNEVALAYIWSQPFPAVAIIGPRKLQQLHGSLAAADLRLGAAEISLL